MSLNISTTPPATLLRRLAGLVYDAFLLFAISLGYGAVLLILRIIIIGIDGAPAVNPPLLLQWLGFIGLYIALSGYYVICWRKQGQTLGMKAWRLRLQQPNGTLATPTQCWKRCLAAPLSLSCLGIGYLWCLLPPANQCLHDRYTGTEVIVLPKTN
ncbi:MAG: RDD family protein [Porticoccaceae bacterium]